MPFVGSSRDTQGDLLRRVYMPRMRTLFNYNRILLQLLKRHTKKVKQGEKFSFPLHMAPGSGFQFSDTLHTPPASVEDVSRAYFNHRGMTDKIAIRADFLDDTGSPEASEVSVLDFQTSAVAKNFGRDLSFFLYGDGTGKISGVSSASSGTAFVIDDPRGYRKNMRIDVLLTATGEVGTGGVRNAQITFNRATNTVTLVGATLADGTGADLNANAANYTVYRHNSRNVAIFGLEAAIRTGNPPTGVGNYGDVDRSLDANDPYRGTVHGNSGTPRNITYGLLYDLCSEITDRSEAMPSIALMPKVLFKWFIEYLSQNKRYGGEPVVLKGWARGVKIEMPHGEIVGVSDQFCPPGKIFLLDMDTWMLCQDSEGGFAEKDGSLLHLGTDQVAYYALWYTLKQLVCLDPAGNGVLEDLQETAIA